MNTITEKVLNKIKQEQIKPKSKWEFLVRDGGRWLIFALLVLMAVIAFGLLWFFWSEGPWLYGGRRGLGLIFGRMPILLLLLFLGAGLIALLDFRNTGRGYRYPLIKIALVLLLGAGVLGWLTNYFGMSARVDRAFGTLPYYEDRELYMKNTWQHPENGLLAGEIIAVGESQTFTLLDFTGKEWTIDASRAVWRHGLVPESNLQIKLIGKVVEDIFVADEVRPWMGGRACPMADKSGTCDLMNK